MPYNRKDHYYKLAKRRGYKSRAAFKLFDLNEKYRLIRPGMHVVDLGCAPGGWMQVASELVGPTGWVVGVDLETVDLSGEKNVTVLKGDVFDPQTSHLILAQIGRKVDLVLSDMAPNLSGIKFQDQFQSYQLSLKALEICHLLLKQGGSFIVKVFPGEETDGFKRDLKELFEKNHIFVPDSTRKGSSEVYLVGKGYRGAREKVLAPPLVVHQPKETAVSTLQILN